MKPIIGRRDIANITAILPRSPLLKAARSLKKLNNVSLCTTVGDLGSWFQYNAAQELRFYMLRPARILNFDDVVLSLMIENLFWELLAEIAQQQKNTAFCIYRRILRRAPKQSLFCDMHLSSELLLNAWWVNQRRKSCSISERKNFH